MNVAAGTEEAVTAFAGRFSQSIGEDLESLVFSPLPFAGGQLLVACKDRVQFLREILVVAQRSDPPPTPIHWLRASELRFLSVPSLMGRYAGCSFWLRYRGKVLWGSDIRDRIPLPANPGRLLEVVLTHAMTWDRNHVFLECMARGKYSELITALATLARSLMATGLLLFGEWEVDEATVTSRFAAAFREDGAEELCMQLSHVLGADGEPMPGNDGAEELYRRSREGVWLLERLMRMLRRHVE